MTSHPLGRPNVSPNEGGETKVFTVSCGEDTYGLPIDFVQTIFRVGAITPVPLAPPEIVGLINLRGKINTAASLRLLLGMSDERNYAEALAICIERRGEQFALIVDKIGDVVSIADSDRIHEPPNSDRRREALTSGVFRLENAILPVLDVDAMFEFSRSQTRNPGHRQEGTRP